MEGRKKEGRKEREKMLVAFAILFQKIELSPVLGEAKMIWSHPFIPAFFI
jgi:hypothetical protein